MFVTGWRKVGIFMDAENRLEWNMTAAGRLSPLRVITNNIRGKGICENALRIWRSSAELMGYSPTKQMRTSSGEYKVP
jgi:hypothetical protein